MKIRYGTISFMIRFMVENFIPLLHVALLIEPVSQKNNPIMTTINTYIQIVL